MSTCPRCSAPLATPTNCESCGALLEVSAAATPFEILGLEPRFELDAADLKQRLLRFSRRTHPDFFAAGDPALRELAERTSARLNDAFEVLNEPARRADWLVTQLGGPDETSERSVPKDFLLEVLEWNEALEEARASSRFDARLEPLRVELEERRRSALGAIAASLEPLPPRGSPFLREVRSELNLVRYLDRALTEIEALRVLKSASS